MGIELVYLSKKDENILKAKNDFNKMIINLREMLPNGYSFYYRLVGSSKRNLVLVNNNGNRGFDCDYQIIISKHPYKDKITNKNKSQIYKRIKITDFKDCFDKIINNYGYDKVEDSTGALTIKNIDHENYKIINSFDVVLLLDNCTNLIRTDKENKPHTYSKKLVSNSNDFSDKFKVIKGAKLWSELRDEYKELKEKNYDVESNYDRKKSYSLLIEATNNVINNNKLNFK